MRIDESLSFLRENKKVHLTTMLNLLQSELEDICYIILFGSYARGEERVTSDMDILAITQSEVPREKRGDLCSRFDEADMDLIFYTMEQFRQSECLLVREVRKEGIVVWKQR